MIIVKDYIINDKQIVYVTPVKRVTSGVYNFDIKLKNNNCITIITEANGDINYDPLRDIHRIRTNLISQLVTAL